MSLTLEAISVVDAIARRGSFAAAAAELGKVPSALTYTVRRIEEELDVLLFDRRGRRARLTPAGEELLAQGLLLLRAASPPLSRLPVLRAVRVHLLLHAAPATRPLRIVRVHQRAVLLLVLLRARGLGLADVVRVLESRHARNPAAED